MEITRDDLWNAYCANKMQAHKEKIILDYKVERERLKKRIKYIEQQLDGIGLRDFELTEKERMKSLEVI